MANKLKHEESVLDRNLNNIFLKKDFKKQVEVVRSIFEIPKGGYNKNVGYWGKVDIYKLESIAIVLAKKYKLPKDYAIYLLGYIFHGRSYKKTPRYLTEMNDINSFHIKAENVYCSIRFNKEDEYALVKIYPGATYPTLDE